MPIMIYTRDHITALYSMVGHFATKFYIILANTGQFANFLPANLNPLNATGEFLDFE